MKSTRKRFELRLGVNVDGFKRYQIVRDVFQREFTPCDGIYHEDTVRASLGADGVGDRYALILVWEGKRPPITSQIDTYRSFIRGVLAASHHIDPLMTLAKGE